MKSAIKLSQSIPFTQSFSSKLTKSPLKCKTVTNNLGNTFYPRLVSIYSNLIEAMVTQNPLYIRQTAIPELSAQITRKMNYAKTQGLKMKINQPNKKLLPLKNYVLPQTVFRKDNFYVSVVPKVYFGGSFKPNNPYSWNPQQKLLKMGKNRYIVWNKTRSASQNVKNIRERQILQFIVKVDSNIYINLYNMQNTNIYRPQKVKVQYDQDQFQDIMSTEMVLRSGSQKFDWMLFDLNGIMRNKK